MWLGDDFVIILVMRKPVFDILRTKGEKVFRRFPIALVYLFGSQAQGKARKGSDVDLAVLFADSVPEGQYFDWALKLAAEISDLLNSDNFDLIILNKDKASPVLKFEAVYRGVLVYSKFSFDQRFEFENQVRKEFHDTAHFSRTAFEALLARLGQGQIVQPSVNNLTKKSIGE